VSPNAAVAAILVFTFSVTMMAMGGLYALTLG
jgi:hypothetical protein